MKIISWNVNGLRAAMGKGIWEWIDAQAPDVICFQEIKMYPGQLAGHDLEKMSGYHALWCPAERPGYSGVLTLLRDEPEEAHYSLDGSGFDREGRVIAVRLAGIWLFNLYVPNGKRDHSRLAYKLDFYDRLLELCTDLHDRGEKIILCGDFNTAHNEIDLYHPKQNRNTSGFLPEERAWIDRYLANGFVDLYRHLYPDRIQYTWWTYLHNARKKNVGWRIDYFLISSRLTGQCDNPLIHDEVTGSDHCPISLEFSE